MTSSCVTHWETTFNGRKSQKIAYSWGLSLAIACTALQQNNLFKIFSIFKSCYSNCIYTESPGQKSNVYRSRKKTTKEIECNLVPKSEHYGRCLWGLFCRKLGKVLLVNHHDHICEQEPGWHVWKNGWVSQASAAEVSSYNVGRISGGKSTQLAYLNKS